MKKLSENPRLSAGVLRAKHNGGGILFLTLRNIREAPSDSGRCSLSASIVSASSHRSNFRCLGQNDRHGLRVSWRNDGVGLSRQEAEQSMRALNARAFGPVHAAP
jgi:hypothetical protein